MSQRVQQPQTAGAGAAAASFQAAPEIGGEGEPYAQTKIEPHAVTCHMNFKASLRELARDASKAKFAPPTMAMHNRQYQKEQFCSLKGETETVGDLSHVLMKQATLEAVHSDMPFGIAVNIMGCDPETFSAAGRQCNVIVGAEKSLSSGADGQVLQKDNPAAALDFASKYPNYTPKNVMTFGVHHVPQKEFVLVDDKHPAVSAVRNNPASFQASDLAEMPGGFVKMSSGLFNAVAKPIEEQLRAQLPVRDFSFGSNAEIGVMSAAPAEFPSFAAALEHLTASETTVHNEIRKQSLASFDSRKDLYETESTFKAARLALEGALDAKRAEALSTLSDKKRNFGVQVKYEYNFLPQCAEAREGQQS